MPHKPRPFFRRWWRRFRRALLRAFLGGLVLVSQFMLGFLILEAGMEFLNTGKVSFAIAGLGLILVAGLSLMVFAMHRIAAAIKGLRLIVTHNTVLDMERLYVSEASGIGQVAADDFRRNKARAKH